MNEYKIKNNCPECGSSNIHSDAANHGTRLNNEKIIFRVWYECYDCGCIFDANTIQFSYKRKNQSVV